MDQNEIRKLMEDIETYRRAIADTEGALAEAERELDEALAIAYEKEKSLYPDVTAPDGTTI